MVGTHLLVEIHILPEKELLRDNRYQRSRNWNNMGEPLAGSINSFSLPL